MINMLKQTLNINVDKGLKILFIIFVIICGIVNLIIVLPHLFFFGCGFLLSWLN